MARWSGHRLHGVDRQGWRGSVHALTLLLRPLVAIVPPWGAGWPQPAPPEPPALRPCPLRSPASVHPLPCETRMRPTSIGITPEGWPVIGLCAFTALIFALVGCWPVAVLFTALLWFSCHFFRDPERVVPRSRTSP